MTSGRSMVCDRANLRFHYYKSCVFNHSLAAHCKQCLATGGALGLAVSSALQRLNRLNWIGNEITSLPEAP